MSFLHFIEKKIFINGPSDIIGAVRSGGKFRAHSVMYITNTPYQYLRSIDILTKIRSRKKIYRQYSKNETTR